VITLGVIMADAFDTEQLLDCLEKLKSCLPIQIPVYDFKRHQRSLDMVRKVSFFFFFTSPF
jgi:uridine kinase